MEDPASDYNICPCCGTEFGLNDAFVSHEELRKNWIKDGMKWWAKSEAAPDGWNPYEQLARLAGGSISTASTSIVS